MLRAQNKAKQENTELLGLIDRCTQIIKDDRLMLRQLLKDNNQELIAMISVYRKKTDLRMLQQELRRYINKLKGKPQCQTRCSKENVAVPVKASRTPQRDVQPVRANIRNIVSPPSKSPCRQRSISKQTRQQQRSSDVKTKLQSSPCFNEDRSQAQFNYMSVQQIEQQKAQLEQFEMKIKLYTNDNHKLFEDDIQQRPIKRNDIVLASFQNVFPLQSEPNSTVKCEYETIESGSKVQEQCSEPDEQQRRFHNRLYSNMDCPKEPCHQHHNTELDLENVQVEFSTSNVQQSLTEDEILKKYADLFTSPDFLNQCRVTIETQKSDYHELDPSISSKFNFLVPCQSMVCQNDTTLERKSPKVVVDKCPVFSSYTSEQIFDEIFSEASLIKISRAFFRFKLENIYQNMDIDVSMEQLDQLFNDCDSANDGFIDINEMGSYLDLNCKHENRSIFEYFDIGNKGYFTKPEIIKQITQIEDQCSCSINLNQLATDFYELCDALGTNKVTFWEFYLKKNTPIGKELNQIVQQYLSSEFDQ